MEMNNGRRKIKELKKLIAAFLSTMMIPVMCSCGNTNAPQATPTVNETSDTYDTVDKALAINAEKYHVPAMAVVEVSSDEILFSGCYGDCTSNDQDFIIGSLSKSFTAVAIMKLSEEGKVDPDSPITEYMDCSKYFKDNTDYARITVRDLLNQTSGIDTYATFGNLISTGSYGAHVYANANYNLLGVIVQNVSGMSYEDYMRNNVFSPLGMENTYASLSEDAKENMVPGYRNFFGFEIAGAPDYPKDLDEITWTSVPGGYLISSPADMGRYLQMYLRGGEDIISRDSIERMFLENVPGEDEGEYYGMGWIYSEENGKTKMYHTGLVENYVAYMYIYPGEDKAGIVLIAMNDYLVNNIYLDNIIAPLTGTDLPDRSGMYPVLHGVIDLVCIMLTAATLFPLITLKKWKTKNKNAVFEVFRHVVLPLGLVAGINSIAPLFVIRLFAKDIWIVVVICTCLLLLTGLYKFGFVILMKTHKRERAYNRK